MLQEVLDIVYGRCNNFWSLKTNSATYGYFRKTNWPSRAIDTLGIYHFFHHTTMAPQVILLQLLAHHANIPQL